MVPLKPGADLCCHYFSRSPLYRHLTDLLNTVSAQESNTNMRLAFSTSRRWVIYRRDNTLPFPAKQRHCSANNELIFKNLLCRSYIGYPFVSDIIHDLMLFFFFSKEQISQARNSALNIRTKIKK